jgi:MoxR-like ATPase
MTSGPAGTVPVVGLRREREVLTAALQAGRHVLIEGPPGTGKSTLLRDVAIQTGRQVIFVEGNAELTPARLAGQYDPAQVLAHGYVPGSFTDGPLLQAMRGGALLYLEEFNRIPEETLNILITVLAEGEIAVPRLGMVAAAAGFRLIAAMNPFDAIGTARVSQAVADRICRVVLGYQDAAAERAITRAATGENGAAVDFAVSLTRATRGHQDVRMGASVRGAIDLVLLAAGLARLRTEPGLTRPTARDAAYAALSGRIAIADGCDRSPESVLDELLDAAWTVQASAMTAAPRTSGETADPGPGDADGPDGPDGPGKADGPPPAPAAGDGEPGAAGGTAGDGAEGTAGGTAGPAGDAERGAGGADRGTDGRTGNAAASAVPGESRSSLRRGRGRGGSRRTVSRAELAARHAAFGQVSPQVGRLDTGELSRLLATDPDVAATLLADLAVATDRDLATAARRLAARVFVRLAAAGTRPARGTRRLGPGRAQDGDLDLDRTLDRLSGSWPPADAELVTRSWRAHRRPLCLLIDTSGSMSGLAVAIAAVAAAGVVLAAGGGLDPAVVAFGGEATVLRQAGASRAPADLVGELIGLRGHGMTDLAGGLRAAASELARPAAGGGSGSGSGRAGGTGGGGGRGRGAWGRDPAVGLPAHGRRRPGRGAGRDRPAGCAVPAARPGVGIGGGRAGPPRRRLQPAGARPRRRGPRAHPGAVQLTGAAALRAGSG